MDKLYIEKRAIQFFKYFIQFLEIYGLENFGENAEVDWFLAWRFCSSYSVWTSDESYISKITLAKTDEEARDIIFEYIDKQVLDGYPIWRLFKMSEWLSEKLETELNDNERNKDIKYFNKIKCYRCKYFIDELEVFYINYGPNRKKYENCSKKEIENGNLIHNFSCKKRSELYLELKRDLIIKTLKKRNIEIDEPLDVESEWNNSKYGVRYHEENIKNFSYKPFNSQVEDCWGRKQDEWKLDPEKFKRCSYFEEDPEMTFGKFIELHKEIIRPDPDDKK